jgi:hypothetical protein
MISKLGLLLLFLVLVYQCSPRKGLSDKSNARMEAEDIAFLKKDSLLERFCEKHYASNGYNCDSIIQINRIQNELVTSIDSRKTSRKNRFYGVSFKLEYDLQVANALIYQISADSIWLYQNSSDVDSNFNLNLQSARKL